jgi:hypothetical protein
MREIQPCVYIMASRWHGTLYVGVTSDLINACGSISTMLLRGSQRNIVCTH